MFLRSAYGVLTMNWYGPFLSATASKFRLKVEMSSVCLARKYMDKPYISYKKLGLSPFFLCIFELHISIISERAEGIKKSHIMTQTVNKSCPNCLLFFHLPLPTLVLSSYRQMWVTFAVQTEQNPSALARILRFLTHATDASVLYTGPTVVSIV
jgi:hypothetical protein